METPKLPPMPSAPLARLTATRRGLRRSLPGGAALAALFLLASPASADEGDELHPEKIDWIAEFSLEDLLNMEVVSATRTQLRLSEAPARILVITKEQMRRHAYRYLRDIFRDLPGYQV